MALRQNALSHLKFGLQTLTTLSFLWACMGNGFVESVLIAIPTNTISSWKNEFYRWISPLRTNCICLEDLDEVKYSKQEKVKSFASNKGPRALLVSHALLKTIVDQALDVDMVVIDEVRVMVAFDAELMLIRWNPVHTLVCQLLFLPGPCSPEESQDENVPGPFQVENAIARRSHWHAYVQQFA